jgi:hypothetical protein
VTPNDVIGRVIGFLDRTGIEYMLTGSFASSFHGTPRATQDIDIVIAASPEQLRALGASLPPSEYYFDLNSALRAQQREGLFNVIDLSSGWKIDFIFRKARSFSRTEFERRFLVRVEGLALSIASAEDILIAKLEWARQSGSERQIEDAAGILRVRWEDLDAEYVRDWVRELGLEAQWNSARRAAGISA